MPGTVCLTHRKPAARLPLLAVVTPLIRTDFGALVCSLAVMGCAAAPIDATGTDSDASTGGTTQAQGASQSDTTPAASADSTDATTVDSAAEDSSDSEDGTDTGGFLVRPDVGVSQGVPLGQECSADAECESESCFLFPTSTNGVCSECALDSDCMRDDGPGTCTVTGGTAWAVCGDGSAGSLCQSDEGCADALVCTAVIEGNPFMQCGECGASAPCDGDLLCAPQPGGGTSCVEAGSVSNDEPCSGVDDGACTSGHCTEALLQGNPVGIFYCGECSSDDDCDKTEICTPAELMQAAPPSGSLCQDAP